MNTTILRTLVFIATLGGQTCSVASYIEAIHFIFNYDFLNVVLGLPLYGRLFFHIGNLFMCIERAVAVLLVAKYEKYVSVPVTVIIVIVTSSVSVFCAVMLNWLTSLSHVFPQFFFAVFYSLSCFIIALFIRHHRTSSGRVTQMASLQKKYQDKENGRTVPIYTLISMNELVSCSAAIVTVVLFENGHMSGVGVMSPDLLSILEMVTAYRILFINVVTLYNCFIWRRYQNKELVNNHSRRDQYFQQLQDFWNSSGVHHRL
ncbi:hypothetical protein Y032_0130g1536 [Ancylostoma ceylanicum]|uniref:7TM GPCR serpentine receptor class x (Srx) domain-containing protein n=1 Tax=Ancylostoma ceylanicum TaxID=53326 RepID=A0A016T774_9BILA|nr:hypothetical protein Y032_0130g1536 [Ancylostoma ceylanicum]